VVFFFKGFRSTLKRCDRGTAFLPKIMESPRGNSVIIMEIGRSSIQFKRCARGTAFLPKIMENPRGNSAIIMEIGRSSIQFKRCQGHSLPTQDHGEPKRELCHHYGDQPLVDSIYKMCQGHGLPTQDHGDSKRELCHHHGISQKNPFNL